ncbi:hypothetical protein KDA11_03680 [Candidatus Saccharibacteria bacterium]|nr:hypothetical protein [Candidatus Saccharibacteria bacterium]
MDNHTSKTRQVLNWILPTPAQVIIYFTLAGLTLFLSSQKFVDDLLFASGDFNPIRAGISIVDLGLQRIIGEKLAGSLSLAVFWGIIGIVVNTIWWAGSNFSAELNNNLLYSKYVHPQSVSPRAQLQDFIKRTSIRTIAAISGLLYFNFVISTGIPDITNKLASIIHFWETSSDVTSLIGYVLIEVIMLHFVVVLSRFVLLRSRIFDVSI